MGVLDGRVAIVTGASRGIGAEIARRFGQAGAAVAVAARTTEPGSSPLAGTIGETVQQIRDAGGTAVAIPTDLSSPEARERLVAEVHVAIALTAAQRRRLGAALAASYGRAVHLNIVLDPKVIGGMSIQIEGERIDGTVASRLAGLRRRLAA